MEMEQSLNAAEEAKSQFETQLQSTRANLADVAQQHETVKSDLEAAHASEAVAQEECEKLRLEVDRLREQHALLATSQTSPTKRKSQDSSAKSNALNAKTDFVLSPSYRSETSHNNLNELKSGISSNVSPRASQSSALGIVKATSPALVNDPELDKLAAGENFEVEAGSKRNSEKLRELVAEREQEVHDLEAKAGC